MEFPLLNGLMCYIFCLFDINEYKLNDKCSILDYIVDYFDNKKEKLTDEYIVIFFNELLLNLDSVIGLNKINVKFNIILNNNLYCINVDNSTSIFLKNKESGNLSNISSMYFANEVFGNIKITKHDLNKISLLNSTICLVIGTDEIWDNLKNKDISKIVLDDTFQHNATHVSSILIDEYRNKSIKLIKKEEEIYDASIIVVYITPSLQF
jgi:hypothetical protein